MNGRGFKVNEVRLCRGEHRQMEAQDQCRRLGSGDPEQLAKSIPDEATVMAAHHPKLVITVVDVSSKLF